MNSAFDRLSPIQKANINRDMFDRAYRLVAERGDDCSLDDMLDALRKDFAEDEIQKHPGLLYDMRRYCRLIKSIR